MDIHPQRKYHPELIRRQTHCCWGIELAISLKSHQLLETMHELVEQASSACQIILILHGAWFIDNGCYSIVRAQKTKN